MTAIDRPEPTSRLPGGTLTFLFTDVEGSTKLWEARREAMAGALARHDAILRQCIEAHRGHVVKSVGDGFHAVFTTAHDALETALAAQRALQAERWPEAVSLRVRIALHSGAAELRGGDYYGPTVKRAARLLAIAYGGQTLLSEATFDLCRDLLPHNVSFRRLGEHSLKDLARREAVFQLCHPDLVQGFPPLKTVLVPMDEDTPSIAVLPFRDMSPEHDQEYFTDGLAEELLSVLAKIHGLRVASRTSAFSFKGKDVDIPTIAQKLNVATILEGSVRKAGKRARITAQLIRVATDSHLWSQTYDRELEDIFAVQDDIANSVVKELRQALLGEKPGAVSSAAVKAAVAAAAKGRGENAEAYTLYLQGRFFFARLTREDTAKAITYYRRALDVDPAYALARAALARAYCSQGAYNWAPVAEAFTQARDAAEQALQLAPDLAEGHAALGFVRMAHQWDWRGADTAFRRALDLEPGNAEVARTSAILAACLGRDDEAIALLRQAVALDPLSAPAHRLLGARCLDAGLLEEAEASLEKALELNPQGGFTRYTFGLVRLTQGRLDDAQGAFEQEVNPVLRLLGLVLAHHARGQAAQSDAALQQLIASYADGGAYQIASAYAFRGDVDHAFEWLERAYVQPDPGLVEMKTEILLRPLHADPRWRPFLDKMGFSD